MTGVGTPSACDDFAQARAQMREAVHAAAAPLRLVAERLHAAVTERGWSVTTDDMGRVIYLMDDLTRRTDDILSPDANDDSFDEDHDMFIRRVRHDLRNPIGAMAGYLELSIEEAREKADVSIVSALQKFRRDVLGLITLIDSIVTVE